MNVDLVVVGAGVVGLWTARAWLVRHPGARVVVLEKEASIGAHASGRNSGVLHAGFYYAADSLKARFCRDGNARWKAFLDERGVAVRRCGKLVVAQRPEELDGLRRLYDRGVAQGIDVRWIDEVEARRIEPRALTAGQALWSPSTASVEPLAALGAVTDEVRARGGEIRLSDGFLGGGEGEVQCATGRLPYRRLVNCAGLYADRVAQAWGACVDRAIVPFKGLYLYGDEPVGALSTHVYPVPDPAFPFLGVHLTVTVDGHLKIGPTALPALWREAYGGLDGFRLDEVLDIGLRDLRMLADPGFRALAARELSGARRGALVAGASRLIRGLRPDQWTRWGRPGIRAQLVGPDGRLDMDFRIERTAREVHVLNAVSPAFTCAPAFAEHVCDEAEAL